MMAVVHIFVVVGSAAVVVDNFVVVGEVVVVVDIFVVVGKVVVVVDIFVVVGRAVDVFVVVVDQTICSVVVVFNGFLRSTEGNAGIYLLMFGMVRFVMDVLTAVALVVIVLLVGKICRGSTMQNEIYVLSQKVLHVCGLLLLASQRKTEAPSCVSYNKSHENTLKNSVNAI